MSPHQHDGAVPGSGARLAGAAAGLAAAPRVLPAGPSALLLEVDGLAAAMAWHAELLARPLGGQLEALAAATTVLLCFDTPEHAAAAARRMGERRPGEAAAVAPRTHTIGVRYDGEDLEELARLTGLSFEGVIAAHTGTPWTGAFGGFAPGFTYLAGGDPVLDVPRRSSPRTAVPAGAVALAGRFSAVYPRQSPGGWQLLGTTDAVLWDSARERPALIAPGDVVSFVPLRDAALVTSGAPLAGAGETPAPDGATAAHAVRPETAGRAGTLAAAETPGVGTMAAASPALTVLAPGLRTAFQDLGRPGRGDLGVTASGAADRPSAAQANRLVGNPAGAVVLETLLGGLELRAERTVVLALTGAIGETIVRPAPPNPAPSTEAAPAGNRTDARADGPRPARPRAVEPLTPFALRAGETLTLGAPAGGLRGYVAVRGGFAAPAELGSSSSDTLSGLGPAPLAAGQELAVLAPKAGSAVGHPEPAATALPAPGEPVTLRAVPGPRDEWFGPEGLAALEATAWRVTAQSDRVGARLELDPAAGEQQPLSRIRAGELASEGVVAGSLQVPPSGLPVLFLADHPVTGGYPVIAVVLPADVALAAQLPPGTPVRLRLVEAPQPAAAQPASTEGASK